jgi:hypothetical protein
MHTGGLRPLDAVAGAGANQLALASGQPLRITDKMMRGALILAK